MRTRATTTWRRCTTTRSGASTSATPDRRRCSRRCAGPSAAPPGRFERSLEIGSGTGYFSLNLLRAGVIGHATCSDISPGMLESLAENARELGFDVRTRPADAERLPFADASFDLVLGHAVLHHIPDLQRALRRVRARARAGRHDPLRRRALALRRSARERAQADRRSARAAVAAGDRRARRREPAPGDRDEAGSSGSSTSTPSRPAELASACGAPGSRTCASAAKSCSRTGSVGRTARSRRPPTPTRCRGRGACTPTAATSCCRASTGAARAASAGDDLLQPAALGAQAGGPLEARARRRALLNSST